MPILTFRLNHLAMHSTTLLLVIQHHAKKLITKCLPYKNKLTWSLRGLNTYLLDHFSDLHWWLQTLQISALGFCIMRKTNFLYFYVNLAI